MRILLTCFMMFISSLVFGQDCNSIIKEAYYFFQQKDYELSVKKYQEAFKTEFSIKDLHNAICAAAFLENKEQALLWLNYSIENDFINIEDIKAEKDLISLQGNPEWEKVLARVQKKLDSIEAGYDKPLQTRLLKIYEEDQKYRKQLDLFSRASKERDSLWIIINYKDSINLVEIEQILEEYGWVGSDKVGKGSQALFLVIQHAKDLSVQKKYLPMMREAVKNKKLSGSSLALLEDRVLIREGKKQIYGTQIGYGMLDNKETHYVLPLEDPDNVDKRRAEMGLPLIGMYVKNWNIVWDVEEYKKMLPEIEKNHKVK